MSARESRVKFAMLLCWLPAQVGAVSDFARVEKPGEAAMADFAGRRYSGEAGHRAPEGASRARHGQRRSRQTRTSTTFATEPSSEPYSFQSFIMGADALAELESPMVDEVETGGLQRVGRQFTFNDLNFEGFQLGGEQQGGSSRQQSQFQSFPQFTSPAASTSPSLGRARQPIPLRMQSSAPSLQSSPQSRGRRIRPPNADPRPRQRARQLPAPAPTLSFSTTSSASSVSREPLNSVVPATSHRFQNFPSSSNTLSLRERENSSRKLRKKLRVVTRPSVRFEQQRPTMRGAAHSSSRQPNLNSPLASRSREEERTVVVTENPLILKCLDEAEKHAQHIEELENRTALHIEYAQEKQIEIELLEITIEAAKNQSEIDAGVIEDLKASIYNLTVVNEAKEGKISDLADDIAKLEITFEQEIESKHTAILNLTSTLESFESAINVLKKTVSDKTAENKVIVGKLDETKAEANKLTTEKKELLEIIQQLAEIGNPALNFNTFIETASDQEDSDYHMETIEDETELEYDMGGDDYEEAEEDREDLQEKVDEDRNADVPAHMFMPLRSMRSVYVW